MNQYRKGISLALFLVLMFTAGCSLRRSEKPAQCLPIRIGVITAGEDQESGLEQKKGYEMALAEINQAGGVQGCPVELIYKDEGAQADTEAAQVAIRQLADEHVLAILGGTSNDATMRAAAIASYFKVPFLIPAATSDELTQRGNQWVFRLSASNQSSAQTAFEMVRGELGAGANLVILYEQTSYGESTAVVAATAAMAQNLEITGYLSFSDQSEDLTALVEQVNDLSPEVLYIIAGGQDQAATVLEALQAGGHTANMVIGHGPAFSERGFLYAGNGELYPNLDHLILVTNWVAGLPWHGMDKFLNDFQVYNRQNGYSATVPVIRNVEAYAALHLLAGALDNLSLTVTNGKKAPVLEGDRLKQYREELAQSLRNLDAGQRETLYGTVTFDAAGQNQQITILAQVIDGRLLMVYPPRYAEQPPDYISGW